MFTIDVNKQNYYKGACVLWNFHIQQKKNWTGAQTQKWVNLGFEMLDHVKEKIDQSVT